MVPAMDLPFRMLNVFAVEDDRLSGNPLCVFEDGRGLTEEQMQALARQMNLSESVFLLPPSAVTATKRVRIFTPSLELPFAGHPSLGSAAVVRALLADGSASSVILEMQAGLVPVTCREDTWTLRAARAPTFLAPPLERETLAAMLGVPRPALAGAATWVNTGAEQLLVPLADVAAVQAAQPDAALLARHAYSELRGGAMVYVWAPLDTEQVVARFFFLKGTSVIEDPATGSACANLGAWLRSQQVPAPLTRTIWQGQAVGRPSRLDLAVDADGAIFVSGKVVEVARGVFQL